MIVTITKDIVRLNYLPTSQLLKPSVCENQRITVFLAYHVLMLVETSKNLKNYPQLLKGKARSFSTLLLRL